MFKRFILLLILPCCTLIPASAEGGYWGSNYGSGDVILSTDAGFETGPVSEIAVYPSSELILLKLRIAGTTFLDIGAKLSGRAGLGAPSPALDLGTGLTASLHMGFSGLLPLPAGRYFDPVDIFVEAGACFDFPSNSNFPVGPVVQAGVNYWLSSGLALGLKYTRWNSFSGAVLSCRIKFSRRGNISSPEQQTVTL